MGGRRDRVAAQGRRRARGGPGVTDRLVDECAPDGQGLALRRALGPPDPVSGDRRWSDYRHSRPPPGHLACLIRRIGRDPAAVTPVPRPADGLEDRRRHDAHGGGDEHGGGDHDSRHPSLPA
ncbi:hypothetical protein PSU4_13280 [Pseudonocardia sulfidoxydans NBRC 16205]|uniref:Uncharacterized protein n=1 Tax=Pseudonocardia sulfidoxydans NBRC 16205 TaxID=1223511 RepID=A0A511DF70_9PSEU|nr:hypothetical protein PSU4_13280 [Pseudonocardia sulfidoxydans NBRC 16205]